MPETLRDNTMLALEAFKYKQREKVEVRDYLEQKRLGKLRQTIIGTVGAENLDGWRGRRFDFCDEQAGKFRVEFGSIKSESLDFDAIEGCFPAVAQPRVSVQVERAGRYVEAYRFKLSQDPTVERKDFFMTQETARSLEAARHCAAYFDASVVSLAAGLTEMFEMAVPIEAADLVNA